MDIDRMVLYIYPKVKKYRIYEKIFLHMSMTRLSLQFLRYMLKRKSGLFEIERMQESTQDNAQVNGDRYL